MDGTSEAENYQPLNEYSPLQSLETDDREESVYNTLNQGASLAASLSQLPGVASSVFSSFSNILKGTSISPQPSREPSVPPFLNNPNLPEEQPLPTFENLYIGPSQNLVPDIPVAPPTFYSPSEAPSIAPGPCLPPTSIQSANTFRLKERKKLYAPVPGLSGAQFNQPPAPSGIYTVPLNPSVAQPSGYPDPFQSVPPVQPPQLPQQAQQSTQQKSTSSFSLSSFFTNPLPLLDKLHGTGEPEYKPEQLNWPQETNIYTSFGQQDSQYSSTANPISFYSQPPSQTTVPQNNYFGAPPIGQAFNVPATYSSTVNPISLLTANPPVAQNHPIQPTAPEITPSPSPALPHTNPSLHPATHILASLPSATYNTQDRAALNPGGIVPQETPLFFETAPFESNKIFAPPSTVASLPISAQQSASPSATSSAFHSTSDQIGIPLASQSPSIASSQQAPPLAAPPSGSASSYRLQGRPLYRRPIPSIPASINPSQGNTPANFFNPITQNQPIDDLPLPSSIPQTQNLFNPLEVTHTTLTANVHDASGFTSAPPPPENYPLFVPASSAPQPPLSHLPRIQPISTPISTPPPPVDFFNPLAQTQNQLTQPQSAAKPPVADRERVTPLTQNQPPLTYLPRIDPISTPILTPPPIDFFNSLAQVQNQLSQPQLAATPSAADRQSVTPIPQNQPPISFFNPRLGHAPQAPPQNIVRTLPNEEIGSFLGQAESQQQINIQPAATANSIPLLVQETNQPIPSIFNPPTISPVEPSTLNSFIGEQQQLKLQHNLDNSFEKQEFNTSEKSFELSDFNPENTISASDTSQLLANFSVSSINESDLLPPTITPAPINTEIEKEIQQIRELPEKSLSPNSIFNPDTTSANLSTELPLPPPPVTSALGANYLHTAESLPVFTAPPPLGPSTSSETSNTSNPFRRSSQTPKTVQAPTDIQTPFEPLQPAQPANSISSFFTPIEPSKIQSFDPFNTSAIVTNSNNPNWFNQFSNSIGNANAADNNNQTELKTNVSLPANANATVEKTPATYFDDNKNQSNDIQYSNFFNNPPLLTDHQEQDKNFNIIGNNLANKRLAKITIATGTHIDPAETLSASSNVVEPASSAPSEFSEYAELATDSSRTEASLTNNNIQVRQ